METSTYHMNLIILTFQYQICNEFCVSNIISKAFTKIAAYSAICVTLSSSNPKGISGEVHYVVKT